MAYYYESEDARKGKVLDGLARDYLKRYDNNAAGEKLLQRVASIFPSLEKLLDGWVPEDVAMDQYGRSPEELFREAAETIYEFMNELGMPASLAQAITATDDVTATRFQNLFEDILHTSEKTSLQLKTLYPSLEQLVRTTGSFASMEKISSKYNLLFANPSNIPLYTEIVAGLAKQSDWNIDSISEITLGSLDAIRQRAIDLKDIAGVMGSLPEEDLDLLFREMQLILDAGIQGVGKGSAVGSLNLSTSAEGTSIKGTHNYGERFGLYLGLLGSLGRDHEFNLQSSSANIENRSIAAGSFTVFNKDDGAILAGLPRREREGILIEGLSEEDIQSNLLDLLRVGSFVPAVYTGISILSDLAPGKKKLQSSSTGGSKSSVTYTAPGWTATFKNVNVKQQTVDTLFLSVKTPDRAKLYRQVLELEDEMDFLYDAGMFAGGVELAIHLKDFPAAGQKRNLQKLLDTIDSHISLGTSSRQCSLPEFITYLNTHASYEGVKKVMQTDAKSLQTIGGLFLYPKTFQSTFPHLQPELQERVVETVYSLDGDHNLGEAREWLSENYQDLVTRTGLKEL